MPYPPIRVLNKVADIHHRLFRIGCDRCTASLEFQAHHIQRRHEVRSGHFLFLFPVEVEETTLVIQCPICDNYIPVSRLLPEWMREKLDLMKAAQDTADTKDLEAPAKDFGPAPFESVA